MPKRESYILVSRKLTGITNLVPAWSTLRTLGSSRLLALTALTPFLGSLILFNHQLVDALKLSTDLIAQWKPSSADNISIQELAKAITLRRLQITYFGLLFLGTASFLFTIRCPSEIKRHDHTGSYIETEKPLMSIPRIKLLFYDVTSTYHLSWRDQFPLMGIIGAFAYPPDLANQFAFTLKQMAENIRSKWDTGDLDYETRAAIRNCGDDPNMWLNKYSLNLDDGIVPWVAAGHLIERDKDHTPLFRAFEDEAPNHLIDLLTLKYGALDRSRPLIRFCITIAYILGFTILAIPTWETFRAILGHVISR